MEETRKRIEEAETKVEKGWSREKWKGSRWIVIARLILCSGLLGSLFEGSGGADLVRDAGECGSNCEVTDCVPVRVFDSFPVSFPNSQFGFRASQILSFLEKRSASGKLVCDQGDACVPEDAIQSGAWERQEQGAICSRRYTAARKADVAWTTTWGARHDIRESDRELDANHSWNLRERVVIRGMEDDLGRSEATLVEVEELETCLLGPSDVAGVIAVLAKKTRDGGGSYSSQRVKGMWREPQGGRRLCKRTRTEATGSYRKPSSTWT